MSPDTRRIDGDGPRPLPMPGALDHVFDVPPSAGTHAEPYSQDKHAAALRRDTNAFLPMPLIRGWDS